MLAVWVSVLAAAAPAAAQPTSEQRPIGFSRLVLRAEGDPR
jgi:hypothetical protein